MLKNLNKSRQSGILIYLLILTGFFTLFELSFFVLCTKAYLSDFSFMSNKMQIPVSILPDILFFIGAQLAIHVIYTLAVWFSAYFCGYVFHFSPARKFNLALALWLGGIAAVLALNQTHFPYSKFSQITATIFFTPVVTEGAALILSAGFLLAFVIGVSGFLMWLIETSLQVALLFLFVLATSIWGLFHQLTTSDLAAAKYHTQPNVILIGIDSLRPDYLGYFGADIPTPFIDNILEQSTVFAEAITPLARTFPSWSTILLGQYPRQSGIRFNLADIDKVNLSRSLPAIFRQHGYQTIYATDETRFSNIDQRYGFDEAITPPIGLNDFLLGTFNDFPFSNLLVNTALGQRLFPYSYANRPVFITYEPESFLQLMRPRLMTAHDQPLFLAVHFCLPHHPYLWADALVSELNINRRYQASVARVDEQIKSFFALLNQAHLLDHSIIVLLSDHGEAIELPGDRITEHSAFLGKRDSTGQPPRFYPPSLDNEQVNESVGHGTDVLGLPQYHSLLAFKLYGMGTQHIGAVTGVVPLSDIKQTLLTLAGIKNTAASNTSLAGIIRGTQQKVALKHVFIESDYSPESIRTIFPETRKVILDGIELFQINADSTRLTVRPGMGEMIIRSKQYADIYGEWMLALYPKNQREHTPILINLQSGLWTDDLQSGFALHSPANKMLAQMKLFYGNEI